MSWFCPLPPLGVSNHLVSVLIVSILCLSTLPRFIESLLILPFIESDCCFYCVCCCCPCSNCHFTCSQSSSSKALNSASNAALRSAFSRAFLWSSVSKTLALACCAVCILSVSVVFQGPGCAVLPRDTSPRCCGAVAAADPSPRVGY